MEKMKKQAQTPEETAQELSDLARKLVEMDRAEGAFGEAMADAVTDKYLEEIIGGVAAVTITTPGSGKNYKGDASSSSLTNDRGY